MTGFTEELEERRSILLDNGFDSYCLFTHTGKEEKLSVELNASYPEIVVLPFKRMVHKSKDGIKRVEEEVILPGYVFVFVPKGKDVSFLSPLSIPFRRLRSEENPTGILKGSDKQYAEWVINCGGLVGMSKAVKKNGRVKIIAGPLTMMEGKIVEYSTRSRNCRVQVDLFGRRMNAWLPFEYVEMLPEKNMGTVSKETGKA